MTQKMTSYTRKLSTKINVRMAEPWTNFETYMRKLEEFLLFCTAPEFSIAVAHTYSRYSLSVAQKTDTWWTACKLNPKKGSCTIIIFRLIPGAKLAEPALLIAVKWGMEHWLKKP